jgi:hypothetical protein
MDKHEPHQDKDLRTKTMGSYVTPFDMGRLIVKTTNNILGDEAITGSPSRQYAAEYLGFLSARQEAAAETADIMEKNYPKNGRALVNVGELMFDAGTDMRQKYDVPVMRDPQMPANPADAAGRAMAAEARAAVDAHLARAHEEMFGDQK